MANGRNKSNKGNSGRDGGGFVALPWSVLDCPAYAALSHPARALLFELARQFVRDNNGRLLLSAAYLLKRGWRSADVITRSKRELLAAGFIHETVKGHRPNRASWYAVTWQALDRLPGYDVGAAESFLRGAYRQNSPLKNASVRPSHGVESPPIAPSHGVEKASPTPSHGAIRDVLRPSPTPSHGNHLDMPSIGSYGTAPPTQQTAHETLAGLWKAVSAKPAKLWHVGVHGPAIGVSVGAPVHCAATTVRL